tara:strand:+ start:5272 stop:5478 length:207 start_codon:yes stop_codon:yes gene_type:complete
MKMPKNSIRVDGCVVTQDLTCFLVFFDHYGNESLHRLDEHSAGRHRAITKLAKRHTRLLIRRAKKGKA